MEKDEIIIWFSRKTAKIRYKIILSLIKYITPSLNKKLSYYYYYVWRTPRPSTEFMKMYFDNKPLVGAEIGVNIGGNALSLLRMLNIKKLYLVDMYVINKGAYAKAIKRLEIYKSKIQFIIKKSVDASMDIKEQLDFVYIDADHQYNFVYEDLDVWYPLVRKGGVVGGHDILNIEDVMDAVQDWCIQNEVKFIIDPPD